MSGWRDHCGVIVDKNQYRLTVATFFTLLRIALIPVIIFALCHNCWVIACMLFALSALTDFLDGFVARTYNQQTALGALLDPLADKLLMIAVFTTLWYKSFTFFVIPRWFIILLITKELLLVVGSVGLLFTQYRIFIKASVLGKLAMLLQILFIVWLFISYICGYNCPYFNQIMLYLTAIMIMSACFDYLLKMYIRIKK